MDDNARNSTTDGVVMAPVLPMTASKPSGNWVILRKNGHLNFAKTGHYNFAPTPSLRITFLM